VLTDKTVLKLTTIRSHDQYNTMIYGLNDRTVAFSGGVTCSL
jgi:hypothetical protein